MLFHVVPSVLLSMVAFSTVFLLVEVIQQPIRIVEIGGYWSCHGEQIEGYHMKENKNLYPKLVAKVTLHFVWDHLSRKTNSDIGYPLAQESSSSMKFGSGIRLNLPSGTEYI